MGKIRETIYSLLCSTKLYYNIKLTNKTVSAGNQRFQNAHSTCLTGEKADIFTLFIGFLLRLTLCFGRKTKISIGYKGLKTLAPFNKKVLDTTKPTKRTVIDVDLEPA